MISRTYICRMPNSTGVPLDIAVQNAPGARNAPVGTGGAAASAANGAYYELRNRVIRFPVLAAAGAAGGFVARARLGWRLSLYRYGATTLVPGVLLSASIINSLSSTEGGGPIIAPAALADPGYGPTIRLINDDTLIQGIVIVHFGIFENKDEDRDPSGSV